MGALNATVHFKMVTMVTFMCIFPQFKKLTKKVKTILTSKNTDGLCLLNFMNEITTFHTFQLRNIVGCSCSLFIFIVVEYSIV